MAFQPIPNGALVTTVGTLAGENCVNTYYFTQDGAWGEEDLQDLVDVVDGIWGTFVDTWLSDDYSYLRTEGRDMRASVGVQAMQDAGATVGGLTSPVQNNNVALAVARRSGLTGRSSRGRIYLGGLVNDHMSAPNVVSSAFVTGIEAMLAALEGAAQGIGWQGVIVSRVQAGVPLTEAIVYSIVEWVVLDLVTDSMRRRLPGRGS